MYKSEAISAMQSGKRITHRFFTDDEFITMKDGKIMDEKSYTFDPDEFWMERTGPDWETDWQLYSEDNLLDGETKDEYLRRDNAEKIKVLKDSLDKNPDSGMILTVKNIKDKEGDKAMVVFSAGFGSTQDIVQGFVNCMIQDEKMASTIMEAVDRYKVNAQPGNDKSQRATGQNDHEVINPNAAKKIKQIAEVCESTTGALLLTVAPKADAPDTATVEFVVAGNNGDLTESLVRIMKKDKRAYDLLMTACAMATFGDK